MIDELFYLFIIGFYITINNGSSLSLPWSFFELMNSELMIALYLLLDQKKETIACSSINLVRNAKAPKKNLDLRFMSNNQTTLIEDVIRFSNFPQRFLCFIREDCGCYHFKNAQSTLLYADIQGNWKKCPSVELSHGLMKIWQNRAPVFCCSVKGHIFVDLQIQDNFFLAKSPWGVRLRESVNKQIFSLKSFRDRLRETVGTGICKYRGIQGICKYRV